MTESPAPNPPDAKPAKKTMRVPPIVPITVAAGMFMEELDSSIIATSLPQMAATYGVSVTSLTLTLTAYLLSIAIFLPVSGWMADRYGARRVFTSAIAVFLLGSIVCGAAVSVPMLVAGRVLQGLGGAMMNPVGRLILVRSFSKSQLLVASSYTVIPGMAGPILGPVLGGFITTYINWRWNFFINVPAGIVGICLALRYIKDLPPTPPRPFDWRGYALIALGMTASQVAVELLAHGGIGAGAAFILLCFAAAFLAAYAYHARVIAHPLVDLALLKFRTLRASVVTGGVYRIALGGIPFLLPLMFQTAFGFNALDSGGLTIAASFGVIAFRLGLTPIIRKFGIRQTMIVDAVLVTIIVGAMGFFTAATPAWLVFLVLFLWGLARSVQYINMQALAYADTDPAQAGDVTTMVSITQRFTISIGVALSTMLLAFFSAGHAPTASDFTPVFLILAGLVALSGVGFSRLKPEDGWQVSNHKESPK